MLKVEISCIGYLVSRVVCLYKVSLTTLHLDLDNHRSIAISLFFLLLLLFLRNKSNIVEVANCLDSIIFVDKLLDLPSIQYIVWVFFRRFRYCNIFTPVEQIPQNKIKSKMENSCQDIYLTIRTIRYNYIIN